MTSAKYVCEAVAEFYTDKRNNAIMRAQKAGIGRHLQRFWWGEANRYQAIVTQEYFINSQIQAKN